MPSSRKLTILIVEAFDRCSLKLQESSTNKGESTDRSLGYSFARHGRRACSWIEEILCTLEEIKGEDDLVVEPAGCTAEEDVFIPLS
jgi:hypothetical protein